MSYRTDAGQSWGIFAATVLGAVALKVGCNVVVPGSSGVVDLSQACLCLYSGDGIGFIINGISGVVDVCSFGLASAAKEVAQGAAKNAAKTAVKQEAKRMTAQLLTKGAKDAATKAAKAQVAKVATKQVGEFFTMSVGKELLSETCEGAFREGTKKSVLSLARGLTYL